MGNRTHVTETVSGVTRGISYTYDSLYRLTAADYSTGEIYAYQYDPVGNRTAMTTTIQNPPSTIHYAYDAANRLTNTDGVTYTWDNRGNLLSDGTFTYTYNSAGRMVQAQSLTATLVYTYNADGLRVAQSVNGDVNVFTWDWATGVPELLSDGESTYLIGYDTLGWQTGGDWRYVLPDALGSVRQETDADGGVTVAREWSPFGEELGGEQTGLGFTGEWYDTNIGMTYLRARWYDNIIGRLTQQDPVAGNPRHPISFLTYQYSSNNPINRIDPSGEIDRRIWNAAISGAISEVFVTDCPRDEYNYQPFERLNIFLGHQDADALEGYDSVWEWNRAQPGLLRAMNNAVTGLEQLLGSEALAQLMEQMPMGKGIVLYDPPAAATGELYYLPGSYIGIESQRFDWAKNPKVLSAIKQFLKAAKIQDPTGELVMTGSLAHELTHMLSAISANFAPDSNSHPIVVEYCNEVRGFCDFDMQWFWYPITTVAPPNVPNNTQISCGVCNAQQGCADAYNAMPREGLANVVGLYMIDPTIFDQPIQFANQTASIDISHIRTFIETTFTTSMQ